MADSWIEETERLLGELKKERDLLQLQLDGVRSKIESTNTAINGAEVLLQRHRDENVGSALGGLDDVVVVPDPKIDKTKSVRLILMDFARDSGGYLSVKAAVKAMQKAGKLQNGPNATPQVYSIIKQAGTTWRKARPGLYELIENARETDDEAKSGNP